MEIVDGENLADGKVHQPTWDNTWDRTWGASHRSEEWLGSPPCSLVHSLSMCPTWFHLKFCTLWRFPVPPTLLRMSHPPCTPRVERHVSCCLTGVVTSHVILEGWVYLSHPPCMHSVGLNVSHWLTAVLILQVVAEGWVSQWMRKRFPSKRPQFNL